MSSPKQSQTDARKSQAKTVIERTYRASVEELWALWTTKDGFESWWGPEGFRADVRALDARLGGTLHYDMVAATPEMVEAMRQVGAPPSHETRGRFSEFRPHTRLALTHVIDFLPGVEAYEATILVEFHPAAAGHVRMVVTLDAMHDAATSGMQAQGFTSQLTKLDRRFDWRAG